MNTAQDYW